MQRDDPGSSSGRGNGGGKKTFSEWAEALYPRLQRASLSPRLRAYLDGVVEPEDFVHEFLAEKGPALHERGYELPQILTAMRNFAVDMLRKHLRERERMACEEEDLPRHLDPVPGEGDEYRADIMIPHREGLALLETLIPSESSSIDFGAVLLLNERIHAALVAVRLKRRARNGDSPPLVAERIYPWEGPILERRVHRELSTIAEMWEGIADRLNARDPGHSGAAALLAPFGMRAHTWYQWVRRAKKQMVDLHGQEEVRRCFPHWFGAS